MAEYLSKTNLPGADGDLVGLPGQQSVLYSWMRVLAGGGTSEFSSVRMRGPIYDKNGMEILGGGGGSLATLSDVDLGLVTPLQPLDILIYAPAGKWTNAPLTGVFNAELMSIGVPTPGTVYLADVSETVPAIARETLTYTGGNWTNSSRYAAFLQVSGNALTTNHLGLVQGNTSIVYSRGSPVSNAVGNMVVPFLKNGVYQYNIFLEADSSNKDLAALQVEQNINTVVTSYGTLMRQTVKSGEQIQFLLTGVINITNVPNHFLQIRYFSSGGHSMIFPNVQISITEV